MLQESCCRLKELDRSRESNHHHSRCCGGECIGELWRTSKVIHLKVRSISCSSVLVFIFSSIGLTLAGDWIAAAVVITWHPCSVIHDRNTKPPALFLTILNLTFLWNEPQCDFVTSVYSLTRRCKTDLTSILVVPLAQTDFYTWCSLGTKPMGVVGRERVGTGFPHLFHVLL